jgi:preprotein translocase subunit SecE
LASIVEGSLMERLEQRKEEKDKKDDKKKRVPKRDRVSFSEYLSGVKTEIKKVVWPTRKELGAFTTVVVIACTFFALLFAAVDYSVLAALRVVLGIEL